MKTFEEYMLEDPTRDHMLWVEVDEDSRKVIVHFFVWGKGGGTLDFQASGNNLVLVKSEPIKVE